MYRTSYLGVSSAFMETPLVRRAAVAGRFYPSDPADLRRDLNTYLDLSQENSREPKRAIGCMVPHAGYVYSGHVAGAVFGALEIPEVCLVLCPNHTGMGQPLAIMSEGEWETPLGSVAIDTALASALKESFPALEEDAAAHGSEHAIEVELPFLQIRQKNLRIVPIALGTRQFEMLEQLGETLAAVITSRAEPVLIVASSDMNHYESDAITRVKDGNAIEPILRLDARGLYDVVTQQRVSMCGFGPAVAMLTAAKKLGAGSAELVKYATSGDISGDRDLVVGYAGVIVNPA
jgi:AmmeMemoRadiSam system protein B